MTRCFIVEDEPFNRQVLEDILEDNFPNLEKVGFADNIEEARKAIAKIQPDLIFLDVELPDGQSFELLEEFKNAKFQIIFITSHDNYAVKAFKYSAVDYILKPINIDELTRAITRALERKKDLDDRHSIDFLLSNLGEKGSGYNKIALPSSDGLSFVDVLDIIRCEADSNYTIVYTKSGEKHVISRSLKEFEELLPEEIFFRVHKSHLVNLNRIQKYVRHDGGYVVLEDGTNITIATRKRDAFLQRLKRL